MRKTLSFRGKAHELTLEESATGSDLIDAGLSLSGLSRDRMSIGYEIAGKNFIVQPDQKVGAIPVSYFHVVDAGPQFSYYGIYILQYLGALLIWPAVTWRLRPTETTFFRCASAMWVVHFVKRIVETHAVHIFSRKTASLSSLLEKCCYYWSTSALMTVYVHRVATERTVNWLLMGLFFLFEILNLYCHVRLRYLRPNGSKAHYLPRGFLFNRITCPHYCMEILSWTCFALFVRVWPAYIFLIIESLHMFLLADNRRRALIFANSQARQRGRITPFAAL